MQQRRGRAGRVRPGACFRLLPRAMWACVAPQQAPEVLRIPLEALCLSAKAALSDIAAAAAAAAAGQQRGGGGGGSGSGAAAATAAARGEERLQDVLGELLTPPAQAAADAAVGRLAALGALRPDQGLTALGRHLTAMPMDARDGKALIFGCMLRWGWEWAGRRGAWTEPLRHAAAMLDGPIFSRGPCDRPASEPRPPLPARPPLRQVRRAAADDCGGARARARRVCFAARQARGGRGGTARACAGGLHLQVRPPRARRGVRGLGGGAAARRAARGGRVLWAQLCQRPGGTGAARGSWFGVEAGRDGRRHVDKKGEGR
jgi:hypothetical protein